MPVEVKDLLQLLNEDAATLAGGVQQQNLPPGVASPGQPGRPIPSSLLVQQFIEQHQRPGIPLDVNTGAPLGTRIKAGLAPDENTRIELLQRTFQGAQLEPIEGGNVIVRNLLDPKTGQPVDMLVDELGLSLKDMTDLSAAVPEVVGAILGVIGARRGQGKLPPQLQGKIAQMLTMAVGGEVGAQTLGGVTDLSARALAQQDIRLGEIAGRRAVSGAVGVGLETLTGGSAMAFNRLRNGLPGTGESIRQSITDRILTGSQPGLPQTEGLAAAARLEAKSGVRVRLTLGERTGNESVLATEAITGKTPFGKRRFKMMREAGDQDMLDTQAFIQGNLTATAKDEGVAAVSELRNIVRGSEAGVASLELGIIDKATDTLNDAIQRSTGLGNRVVLTSEAGNVMRAGVESQHQAFKSKSGELVADYMRIPEASDPFVLSKPMADELAPLHKRLTEIGETVEEPSALFDAYDRPLPSTTKEGERKFLPYVPAPIKKFLSEAVEFPESVTLERIKDFRTFLNTSINESEILTGQQDKMLMDISRAVKTAIDTAAKNTKTPELGEKLLAFNKFYADNSERFKVLGITEMLADPDVRKLGPFAIQEDAMRKPDQYFRMKEVLTKPMLGPDGTPFGPDTENSWKLFKQSMFTELGRRAGGGVGDLVDAKALLREFNSLRPEVLSDLLGSDALRSQVGIGIEKVAAIQGKVSIDEVIVALQKKGASVNDLQALADKQKVVTDLYKNKVIKNFVEGTSNAATIDPEEFVSRYVDLASASDLSQVMNLLTIADPARAQSIRGWTAQKVFHDAMRNPTPTDIARGLRNDDTVMAEPKQLLSLLADKDNKLFTILGKDSMDDLRDYARVENMRSVSSQVAKTVGGLIGGSMLNDIITLNFRQLPAHAKYYFLSRVLTSPELAGMTRTAAKKGVDPNDVVKTIVVSRPFLEAVYSDYEPEAARFIMEQFGLAAGLVPKGGVAEEKEADRGRREMLMQEFNR